MYRQFCRNLKHFLSIMEDGNGKKSSRLKSAEVLLPLTDIEQYEEYRASSSESYGVISNLIYEISQHSVNNPALKKLVWELWAYGFDIEQLEQPPPRNYDIDEVVKIADLMLSTHYFN